MKKLEFRTLRIVIFFICGAMAKPSPAQTFTTLANFNFVNGDEPNSTLVQGSDGNLYGTTFGGGLYCQTDIFSCGAIFKMTPMGALSPLLSFNYSDGAYPSGPLLQSGDSEFFGTSEGGGTFNGGTIFRITAKGSPSLLYSFMYGAFPTGGLVQTADGDLYGTTSGGAQGSMVFKITSAGTFTKIARLDGTNGSSPAGRLLQAADGNFYGTTVYGGTGSGCKYSIGCGTIFKVTPGGALTTLYDFCSQTNCSDGSFPYAGLVQASDGNFYGTTGYGGESGKCKYGCGTIFRLTPSGKLTVLHSFRGFPTDGSDPQGTLIQATDGNFYGTTILGGAFSVQGCQVGGCGMVFKITPTGKLTMLHSFSSGDGSSPFAGLMQAADGLLYGTTGLGGSTGNGTVFSLSLDLPPHRP
ncbi:MAG TPA: choice-of-anchor tandem repeat GloVer-containing protein [Candidatus Sulfotelmatobacter sp.]|nr:choice-of-anchor tandem repeat GloVer-containing protein [Candidatus Sulfotelmatobacter sp.]